MEMVFYQIQIKSRSNPEPEDRTVRKPEPI